MSKQIAAITPLGQTHLALQVSFGGGGGGQKGATSPLDILCPPLEVVGVKIRNDFPVQGGVACIDSVLPPTTGVKILVNCQAANPELVKGQDMSIVLTCAQLHAVKCLGAGFIGVAKFKQLSRGGVNGRGQGLGQGSRLKIEGQNS